MPLSRRQFTCGSSLAEGTIDNGKLFSYYLCMKILRGLEASEAPYMHHNLRIQTKTLYQTTNNPLSPFPISQSLPLSHYIKHYLLASSAFSKKPRAFLLRNHIAVERKIMGALPYLVKHYRLHPRGAPLAFGAPGIGPRLRLFGRDFGEIVMPCDMLTSFQVLNIMDQELSPFSEFKKHYHTLTASMTTRS